MTWLRYVRWGPFLTGTATLVPMHHIEGLDRDQAQLLPARVDDYVEAGRLLLGRDAGVDGDAHGCHAHSLLVVSTGSSVVSRGEPR